MLEELVQTLQQSLGIAHKRDIQAVARHLGQSATQFDTVQPSTVPSSPVPLGDDCAAIPDGEGYLLFASEGMMPFLVAEDPWFAGWSAVMVNVSDIYAMGGRPIAVVDSLWHPAAASELRQILLTGMQAAAHAYQVPIVGGHTNGHSPYAALSVAIVGRAQRLITSFHAQPGDHLLMVIDLRGQPHPQYPFWNAATTANPQRLRDDLVLLPQLAEASLCDAGKDISMGGLIGTTLMLLETSGCGARLNLDAVPCPVTVPLERWLVSFPSYGFLLSVRPERVATVQAQFLERQLVCADVGEVQRSPQLLLQSQGQSTLFWDFDQSPLTGFAPVR